MKTVLKIFSLCLCGMMVTRARRVSHVMGLINNFIMLYLLLFTITVSTLKGYYVQFLFAILLL